MFMTVELPSEEELDKTLRGLLDSNADMVDPRGINVIIRYDGDLHDMAILEFAFHVRAMEILGSARISPYGGEMIFLRQSGTDMAECVMIENAKARAFWTAHLVAVRFLT